MRKMLPYMINITVALLLIGLIISTCIYAIYTDTFPAKSTVWLDLLVVAEVVYLFLVPTIIAYYTKNKILRFSCLYMPLPLLCFYMFAGAMGWGY